SVALLVFGHFFEEQVEFVGFFGVFFLAPHEVAEKDGDAEDDTADQSHEKKRGRAVRHDEGAFPDSVFRRDGALQPDESVDGHESENKGSDEEGKTIPGRFHKQSALFSQARESTMTTRVKRRRTQSQKAENATF